MTYEPRSIKCFHCILRTINGLLLEVFPKTIIICASSSHLEGENVHESLDDPEELCVEPAEERGPEEVDCAGLPAHGEEHGAALGRSLAGGAQLGEDGPGKGRSVD